MSIRVSRRVHARFSLFLLLILSLTSPPASRTSTAAADVASPTPAAPPAQQRRPVSTVDAAAQAAFDDGLTLLYAFNPEQARQSFELATKDDPSLAMAWWGTAMSYGSNINTPYDAASYRHGHDAIETAESLARGANPVERALIDAAKQRFEFYQNGDGDRSAKAYRDAMDSVAATFPQDDDVQTLAAEAEMDAHPWSYFSADGTPTAGTLDLIARLRTVLARDPLHIGANHLAIHAFEESPHPEEALPSADRLASLSFEPAAEHLAHMPAHTYMRVGEYAKAGDANARAVALYDVYLAGDPPGHTNYFGHDCTFGVDAYMMSGEYARARGLAATCARTGSGMIPLVDLRFRRWTVLANDQIASDFVRGMLAAHDGETDVAQTALGKLRTGTSSTVATIQANLVEAELDRQAAKPDAEIAALERAVAAQDTFGYSEPPTFFYPVRESLGAALYRAGRTAEAEQTFRDDLAKNRENPRSLFGLWEILRKEDRAEEASAVRTRFENAWKEADAQLDLQDL